MQSGFRTHTNPAGAAKGGYFFNHSVKSIGKGLHGLGHKLGNLAHHPSLHSEVIPANNDALTNSLFLLAGSLPVYMIGGA